MFIELSLVTSQDGKITKGTQPPFFWAPKKDQEHLNELKSKHKLIGFGSGTYESIKDSLKLDPRWLRMVFTKRLDDYGNRVVPGQLEFTSLDPDEFVRTYEQKWGFESMLLLSGTKLTGAFLKAGLVDRIWWTVTPDIFGSGLNVLDVPVNIHLDRISTQEWDDGSVLNCYDVVYRSQ